MASSKTLDNSTAAAEAPCELSIKVSPEALGIVEAESRDVCDEVRIGLRPSPCLRNEGGMLVPCAGHTLAYSARINRSMDEIDGQRQRE